MPAWERSVKCNFTCASVCDALVISPTKIQMSNSPFDLQFSVKYFGYVFKLDATQEDFNLSHRICLSELLNHLLCF